MNDSPVLVLGVNTGLMGVKDMVVSLVVVTVMLVLDILPLDDLERRSTRERENLN